MVKLSAAPEYIKQIPDLNALKTVDCGSWNDYIKAADRRQITLFQEIGFTKSELSESYLQHSGKVSGQLNLIKIHYPKIETNCLIQ